MDLIFLGTPTFAVPTLERIVGAGHRVLAVFTQPDRPKGRGGQLSRIAGEGSGSALGIAGVPTRADSARRKCRGTVEGDEARRDGRGRLRPDHSAGRHRHSDARHHQCARFAAAEVSRRGAHPVGHRQWRNAHRRDYHADRRGARYRRHAAEVGDAKSDRRRTPWNLGPVSPMPAPSFWWKRSATIPPR